MSIRDIIEAAIRHQEELNAYAHRPYSKSTTLGYLYQIRDEVALMEAVCEAEDNGTDAELTAAGEALQTYRKERGL